LRSWPGTCAVYRINSPETRRRRSSWPPGYIRDGHGRLQRHSGVYAIRNIHRSGWRHTPARGALGWRWRWRRSDVWPTGLATLPWPGRRWRRSWWLYARSSPCYTRRSIYDHRGRCGASRIRSHGRGPEYRFHRPEWWRWRGHSDLRQHFNVLATAGEASGGGGAFVSFDFAAMNVGLGGSGGVGTSGSNAVGRSGGAGTAGTPGFLANGLCPAGLRGAGGAGAPGIQGSISSLSGIAIGGAGGGGIPGLRGGNGLIGGPGYVLITW
jgi:hypothetical protein